VIERFVAWWTAPERPARAYAIAAALGLLVNVLVLGVPHLFGSSSYWDLPQEDSRVYIIGYRHFLHEPWHWPIFESSTLNVPFPKSIAFTDSIPLWALVNKIIATIIPPWGPFSERAYLGLWHGLAYVLQAVFGLACLRAVGERSRAAMILGSLFLLATPAWIFRYGHASLSAHFLLLWALNNYLRTRPGTPLPLGRAWVAQLAIAALVNPYHVAMSFGLFVLSVVRSRTRRSLAWLPLGLTAVGAAAYVAGYFASEAKVPMAGFEASSANLLSPFVPVRGGILGDGTWIANVEAAPFQYEGYAYLGLGYLILVLLFLPRLRTLAAVFKQHAFLCAALVAVSLFALSNHVWWGSHRIVSYAFPSKLQWISQQYRAPGRFVWFPMYVVMLFLLHGALSRFTAGWKLLVVPVVLIVQLADAWGDWKYRRRVTRAPFPPHLDLDAWRKLVHAHDSLFIFPSYDCIFDETLFAYRVSEELQYLASERALPMNGVYSARPMRDCATDTASLTTLVPSDRALYVLLPQAKHARAQLEASGATCAQFEHGRVCSSSVSAIDDAMRTGAIVPVPPPPAIRYGETVQIGVGSNPAHFGEGWSYEEPLGRWTTGPNARLELRLAGAAPREVALKLRAASVVCGDRRSQSVDVMLNRSPIGRLDFDQQANDADVTRSIRVPHPEELEKPVVVIELRPRDTRSPSATGCNADPRPLGLFVRGVSFE
jgi:hypothetical protein